MRTSPASIRTLAAALLVLAAACARAGPLRAQTPPAGEPTVEDTVWAVVLDSLFVNGRTHQLVVADRTSEAQQDERMRSFYEAAVGGMPGIERETAADYWARGAEPRAVGPLPPTTLPVTRVDRAELDSLPRRLALERHEPMDFWRAFYLRYPSSGGLITFSRVGFNPARTQAVLDVSHGCGGLCGEGTLILLTRDPATGRWRVVSSRRTWVS